MVQIATPKLIDYESKAQNVLTENPILLKKISSNCKLHPSAVPAILAEVIRFLTLIAISNETLTPAKYIDDAWHEFILCTRTYCEFCVAHFGRYIHHQPGGSEAKNKAQLERTLALYHQHFGEPPPQFWGLNSIKISNSEPACGSCEAPA